MRAAVPSFVDFVRRLIGPITVQDVSPKTARPWVKRGVRTAYERVGDTSDEEGDLIFLWAFAFEAGAQDAARIARTILSDPAVKGRELDALSLVAEGHGHAAVRAKLRATTPGSASSKADSAVIAFPPREDRT